MDHFKEQQEETNKEQPPAEAGLDESYPPKFERSETSPANAWLRSLVSLALYLVIGNYFFPGRINILLLITLIVMIHELGHFAAMKLFRYNDLGIFFIPLLGAYVSGTKREVSQRESAIILLAGPLPGIVIGIFFFLLWQSNPYEGGIAGISYYTIAILFVILNLFNLLPVYPLDGGQLLNRVFLNEDNWLSRAFIFLSIGLLSWFAWKSNFPVLFIFPLMLLLRLFGERKMTSIEKKIEEEGINTDLDYKDLPDADYWKIRDILIREYPPLKDVPPSPPYAYHEKEEKIMTTIEGLLHRHLIQDLSVTGKLIIFFVWITALASPWLLNMDMSFFRRFAL